MSEYSHSSACKSVILYGLNISSQRLGSSFSFYRMCCLLWRDMAQSLKTGITLHKTFGFVNCWPFDWIRRLSRRRPATCNKCIKMVLPVVLTLCHPLSWITKLAMRNVKRHVHGCGKQKKDLSKTRQNLMKSLTCNVLSKKNQTTKQIIYHIMFSEELKQWNGWNLVNHPATLK